MSLFRPAMFACLWCASTAATVGPSASAQTPAGAPPGVVVGSVVDRTGSAIAAAALRLARLDAVAVPAAPRTTVTDASGQFRIEALVAGHYELIVSAPHFSVDRLVLQVGSEVLTLRVTLATGAFSEEVTVVGTSVGDSPVTLQRLPGTLSVVDSATLASSQVLDVNEALRKVSGVHARDEEGFGLRPNIAIRGLNPTRSAKVLLLEDGVFFTMAPYGDNASYYHPPIERFDHVEVLKGSGQIAYGPQTIGGIVNYVTPSVPTQASGWARIAAGSRDYFQATGGFGTTIGRVGLLIDGMHKQGDGARDHISSRVFDLTAKAQVALGAGHAVLVKVNQYGEDSTLTYSGLTQSEYEANPRQNPFVNDAFGASRTGATATWRAEFTRSLLMTTNVYGYAFERAWWRQSSNSTQRPNDRPDPACGGMANLSTTCGNEGRLREYRVWGVEPRFRGTPTLWGVTHETDFGFRVHAERQDRLQKNGATPRARDGVIVEDNLRENLALSAFIQNRALVGRLTVTPGLRVERIYYERTNRLANDGAGVSGRTEVAQWIPGIGAALAASRNLTMFGGVHRGFAPPRTEDIINNATGGVTELDAELSWNAEVGLRWLGRSGASFEAAWFRMDYENQIVPASLAGGVGATLTNGGETLHQGVEISGRFDTAGLVATRHNTYVRLAYTALPIARFTGTRFSTVPGAASTSVTGHRLPYAPKHLLTLTVGYQHPSGIDTQVEVVGVSDQFSDDLNSIAASADGQRGLIPGYRVWNAAVSYFVAPLKGALYVAVKNAGDRVYIADRSRGVIPGMPRTAQAGIRFRF